MKNLLTLHLESITRQRLADFASAFPNARRLMRYALVFEVFERRAAEARRLRDAALAEIGDGASVASELPKAYRVAAARTLELVGRSAPPTNRLTGGGEGILVPPPSP